MMEANLEPDAKIVPLDGVEILRLVRELTTRWQEFNNEGEIGRNVLMRLVSSGFAKTKLSYIIRNSRTGDCMRLRTVVCGDNFSKAGHKRLLSLFVAQSPPGWFTDDLQNIQIVADKSTWEFAISRHGDQWRDGSLTDYEIVNRVRYNFAQEDDFHPIKDGAVETWQEQKSGFDADWLTVTEAADLICINKGRISQLVDAERLKDNQKTGTERRIDPASILRYAKTEGIVLNDRRD